MSMLSRLLRRDDGGADEELVIEPLRRRHIFDVMAIEEHAYPKPWPEKVFLTEIDMGRRGERTYLAARIGTKLLGYGGLMYALDDAHVTNIAVAPESRRTGVGRRLLAELFWIAIERGCTSMTLEVRASNAGAQEMYRRFGFGPAGVRQRYYENTEDAIVMWCHDIDSEPSRSRLRQLCPEAEPSR